MSARVIALLLASVGILVLSPPKICQAQCQCAPVAAYPSVTYYAPVQQVVGYGTVPITPTYSSQLAPQPQVSYYVPANPLPSQPPIPFGQQPTAVTAPSLGTQGQFSIIDTSQGVLLFHQVTRETWLLNGGVWSKLTTRPL